MLYATIIDGEQRNWIVESGDWIKVQGHSANGYWRNRSEGYDASFERIEDEATIRAYDDSAFFFDSIERFENFITFYMRGEIIEVIND
jgi:hypothetical protein